MDVLDLQIMQHLADMDTDEKERILEYLAQQPKKHWSFEQWLEQVRQLQASMRAERPTQASFSVQDLIDEMREERLNDLMGRP